MKRIIAVLLALAVVTPATAEAKKHHHGSKHHKTTVLKGSFKAVGADGAYTHRKFGKAQLVDNKKRDKLSVHLRRLAPKTEYTFGLYSVPKGTPRCREGASGGTQETAFPPKTKRTNKHGNLNANQRSKTFKADREKRYFVLVSQGDGQVVACAKLDRKGHKGHKKPHKGHKKHGKPHKHADKKPKPPKKPRDPSGKHKGHDKPSEGKGQDKP
jgi:hypothetical protein